MEEFNYVLIAKEKERIAFGSTAEREVLPMRSVGGSKFASHFIREVIPKIDPVKYDSNNAFKKLDEKITSNKGFSSIIYTAPRFNYTVSSTPFLEYHLPPYPPKVQCNNYPFNSTRTRFQSSANDNPAPGSYDILSAGKRKIIYRHSFGGSAIPDSGTDIKCVPENADICIKCKLKPKGDYWHINKKTFLCRFCKEKEDEKPKLFNKFMLQKFRRMRDCSFMHEHEGTAISITLLNRSQLQELAKREAYFGLYYKSRRGYLYNEGPFRPLPWPIKHYGKPLEKSIKLLSKNYCIEK